MYLKDISCFGRSRLDWLTLIVERNLEIFHAQLVRLLAMQRDLHLVLFLEHAVCFVPRMLITNL